MRYEFSWSNWFKFSIGFTLGFLLPLTYVWQPELFNTLIIILFVVWLLISIKNKND